MQLIYVDDVMLTAPGEQEVASGLDAFIKHICDKGKKINPRKIQGLDTSLKHLGTYWFGTCWENY